MDIAERRASQDGKFGDALKARRWNFAVQLPQENMEKNGNEIPQQQRRYVESRHTD